MKKTINIIVILLVLTSIITMQSCKKESPLTPVALLAAMPKTPVPATGTVIAFTAANQTVNLSWEGTATNTIKWDIYFGTSSTPPKVASNITGNSYAAHIGTTGGVYYWQVQTIDANNIPSASAIWNFDVNSNPAAPVLTTPANGATAVSGTAALVWTCTDPESDALTFDVYLGTTATPGVATSGITAKTYSPTLAYNTTYYWKIIAHDSYGGLATSAVNSFTTGPAPADPISVFVGSYTCDEPAETYSYGVSFTEVNSTTLKTTNYWNSGWTANFTLDLTNLTYTLPLTTFATGWTGTESGIINKTTHKMTGTYTIWQNGVINEQGTHTYTHL